MNELYERLPTLGTNKIDSIFRTLKPSLSDIEEIDKITIKFITKRNLRDYAKSIYVLGGKDGLYDIEFSFNSDPKDTLLKDIYTKHKTKDWVGAKWGHDNPVLNLRVDVDTLKQCINWFHSTIN